MSDNCTDGSERSEYVITKELNGSSVAVKHICVGCGGVIDEFEAFEDTVDKDIRPIHDKISCLNAAKENTSTTEND